MTESNNRFSVREALAMHELIKELASIPADDPEFTTKALAVHEKASRMLIDRHERRKIANKVGQAASAMARKEKTGQRNALMREAILKLLEQGVETPAKISQALIAQDIKPPKARRWSITQLRTVAPEIPKREPIIPK